MHIDFEKYILEVNCLRMPIIGGIICEFIDIML
jgi:hypothetical protein